MKKDITIEDITFCLVLGFVITIFILLFSALYSQKLQIIYLNNSGNLIPPKLLHLNVFLLVSGEALVMNIYTLI